ncbi:hypothetical protein WS71_26300 [Burkholderia mayonis]|uniref:Uncharacterized protein n=2 Tax=Burkholderia mayonis TaxID=1385591 RepID=A0A1B4G435_9BURK|nr:hypothetical protein WS71_26300 [Burkholderia mayonis]KVE53131.1 hypothetical protein WS71_07640 [Burkholderia mayonis]
MRAELVFEFVDSTASRAVAAKHPENFVAAAEAVRVDVLHASRVLWGRSTFGFLTAAADALHMQCSAIRTNERFARTRTKQDRASRTSDYPAHYA